MRDTPTASTFPKVLVDSDISSHIMKYGTLPLSFEGMDIASEAFSSIDMDSVLLCVGGHAFQTFRDFGTYASGIVVYAMFEKACAGRETVVVLPEDTPDEVVRRLIEQGAFLVADIREHVDADFDALYPRNEFSLKPDDPQPVISEIEWSHEPTDEQVVLLAEEELFKYMNYILRTFPSMTYCSRYRHELFPAFANFHRKKADEIADILQAMACGHLTDDELVLLRDARSEIGDRQRMTARLLRFSNSLTYGDALSGRKQSTEMGILREKLETAMSCWEVALAPVAIGTFDVPDGKAAADTDAAALLDGISGDLGADIMVASVLDNGVPLEFVASSESRGACHTRRSEIIRQYPFKQR